MQSTSCFPSQIKRTVPQCLATPFAGSATPARARATDVIPACYTVISAVLHPFCALLHFAVLRRVVLESLRDSAGTRLGSSAATVLSVGMIESFPCRPAAASPSHPGQVKARPSTEPTHCPPLSAASAATRAGNAHGRIRSLYYKLPVAYAVAPLKVSHAKLGTRGTGPG